MTARRDGQPKKPPAVRNEVVGGVKPFVLKDGDRELQAFWNRNAAKLKMRELNMKGHAAYVWSRLEGAIIFSPMDA